MAAELDRLATERRSTFLGEGARLAAVRAGPPLDFKAIGPAKPKRPKSTGAQFLVVSVQQVESERGELCAGRSPATVQAVRWAMLASGMPLILRRSADQYPRAGWPRTETNWVVLNGSHVIGSISQVQGGPSDGHWKWSVTDIRLGAARPWTFGTVSSLDEAKEQLAIAWRKRIAEEGLSEV